MKWWGLFVCFAGALTAALASCTYGVYEHDGAVDAGLRSADFDLAPNQDRRIEFDDGNFVIVLPAVALTSAAKLTVYKFNATYDGISQTGYGVYAPGLVLTKPALVFLRRAATTPNQPPTPQQPDQVYLGIASGSGGGGSLSPLPVGGTSPTHFFGLTTQLGVFGLGNLQNSSECQNPPSCIVNCCGSVKPRTNNGSASGFLCLGVSDAEKTASCMQTCSDNPADLTQNCNPGPDHPINNGPALLQSCSGSCAVESRCCVQNNVATCGAASCSGVSLKCDDQNDCTTGLICCLNRAAGDGGMAEAICAPSCDHANRLCDPTHGEDCSGPGAGCMKQGSPSSPSNCPISLCAPAAPIPGVCN